MSSTYFTGGSFTAHIYWYLPWLSSPFTADDDSWLESKRPIYNIEFGMLSNKSVSYTECLIDLDLSTLMINWNVVIEIK